MILLCSRQLWAALHGSLHWHPTLAPVALLLPACPASCARRCGPTPPSFRSTCRPTTSLMKVRGPLVVVGETDWWSSLVAQALRSQHATLPLPEHCPTAACLPAYFGPRVVLSSAPSPADAVCAGAKALAAALRDGRAPDLIDLDLKDNPQIKEEGTAALVCCSVMLCLLCCGCCAVVVVLAVPEGNPQIKEEGRPRRRMSTLCRAAMLGAPCACMAASLLFLFAFFASLPRPTTAACLPHPAYCNRRSCSSSGRRCG